MGILRATSSARPVSYHCQLVLQIGRACVLCVIWICCCNSQISVGSQLSYMHTLPTGIMLVQLAELECLCCRRTVCRDSTVNDAAENKASCHTADLHACSCTTMQGRVSMTCTAVALQTYILLDAPAKCICPPAYGYYTSQNGISAAQPAQKQSPTGYLAMLHLACCHANSCAA